ncbi:MAG: GNAT family N-acetyltransferase [Planctomycetes bacterium]|nr:GNAT family N-acetyltransferase [Planctomycetota bacterium]
MKTVPVKTSYLQMFAPPERDVPPPTNGVDVIRANPPTVGYYRFLYEAVGSNWNWIERTRMSDEELVAIIHDPRVEFYVLYVHGSPAGFCEMDRRAGGEVQLMYFGLMAEFIGRGLGGYFLNWNLRQAWTYSPRRVWLHTCDLDHKSALPVYQRGGLVVYDERVVNQTVLQPALPASQHARNRAL